MMLLPVDGNFSTLFCNSTGTNEWLIPKENKEMHT